MKSLSERAFHRVYRLTRYHAWWVVLFFLILTGVGVYYGRDVQLRSGFLELLPENDPLIDAYRANEEYITQSDYIALLLTLIGEIPPAEREAKLLAAARRIGEVLREDPEFVDVTYLQEISPRIPDQYIHLFQLQPAELARIEQSVELAQTTIAGGGDLSALPDRALGDVYTEISREFNDTLTRGDFSLGAGAAGASMVREQIDGIVVLNAGVLRAIEGLEDLPAVTTAVDALAEIFSVAPDATIREPAGYFSRDKTRLLMTVSPRLPSMEGVAYCKDVTDRLYRGIAAADPASLGVRVGVTGTYPYTGMTNQVINTDMTRTTIISAIGVFVIFFIAFGSVFYSIIAVVPLLISLLLTMCWAKFAVDGFNLVTTFLPALVLGLGIDYAIHLIARYAEERSAGRSLNRALHASVLHKGEASLFAAVTTALVFLGLLTSKSRALFEMGIITSAGVMIAYVITLLVVPAMITLSHFLFRHRRREGALAYASRLGGIFRFVTDKGRAIFVIVLVLTFFVAFQAARTRFVFSSTDLVPELESTRVLEEISQHFEGGPTGIGNFFAFYASTEEELHRLSRELSTHELVESVRSALDLLPGNLAEQRSVLDDLDIAAYVRLLGTLDRSFEQRASAQTQIRVLLTQFSLLQYAASMNGHVEISLASDRILGQLRAVQTELAVLDVRSARENVAMLRTALVDLDVNLQQIRDLPPMDTLLRDILLAFPEGIRTQYLTRDGDFVIQAVVSREIFNRGNLATFARFASSISDNYFGQPLVAKHLEDYMKRDFLVSTLLAAVLILFVLWRSLRGWVRALLAASPLILGYIWMLGGMRLLSIDFNFLSIVISPLLIGVGVDNGIHILHRTLEDRSAGLNIAIERGVSATAVAVILTSLTTMVVFGSLLAARTLGLRMLGASAMLGIGFSLLFSLVFLPAALRVEGGKWV